MGITSNVKTEAKASLRLYNQISSFLFEQDCGELKDNSKAIDALIKARRELAKIIKKN